MLYVFQNPPNKLWILIIFCLLTLRAAAQPDSYPIEVTFNKTSSVVFPNDILSVDRGSRDLLVQKAKGLKNVLQLKAGKKSFQETNLTVFTAGGMLYHFMVRYADHPIDYIHKINSTNQTETTRDILFQDDMTSAMMERLAKRILSKGTSKRIKRSAHHDMHLELNGIYIRDNMMFFRLKISNGSYIPFHTELARIYIVDKQKVRRTAAQELAEKPLYQFGDISVINGKASQEIIYALPKFTIPDAKVLTLEVMERRGGRHLKLQVHNNAIMQALPIP